MTTSVSAIKVLLVDDNAEMRLLMRTLLETAAIEDVREAGSAAEALDILATWKPDIALVDYQMPGQSGAALTEAIRAASDPQLARLPVIIITGHGVAQTIQRASAAGANDFIVKPFNAKVLLGRIDRCLRNPRTIAEMVQARARGVDES
ncbi:response regulator [Pararhodospirillum photometricum]|uniref:CheY-like receiver n=1 Tax=Pararhodospirillum photometricum DSM 122 TaxID=1150469 RepID=H6SNS1_PARPM|nr:response regulator [Pararhodospirillum photometricum]CCG09402.1 CheY-like receiver [Pararhodospirillum photometricum DSM 122]